MNKKPRVMLMDAPEDDDGTSGSGDPLAGDLRANNSLALRPPDTAARLDAEWVALQAFRGLLKMAAPSDELKSTYNNALDFGAALYPQLLGSQDSVLRRVRESDVTRHFRQLAHLRSIQEHKTVEPLTLLRAELADLKALLGMVEASKADRREIDQLKRRFAQLVRAEEELEPRSHTEHQLIFRDAHYLEHHLPQRNFGHGYRDFQLPDGKLLRVRLLHPDIPEQVTGADLIYERHHTREQQVSIVAVQYKIWKDRTLYLKNPRMGRQLSRLSDFLCTRGFCEDSVRGTDFRFPHCAAFLRPTDKLQTADQKLLSTGEHLPLCRIDQYRASGRHGADVLRYDQIRDVAVSGDMFEQLFSRGKLGSRRLDYREVDRLYADHSMDFGQDSLVIYAQEG